MASLAGRFGRNPASAMSWRLGQDCVVTALDGFLTTGEQEFVARGDVSLVRQLRSAFVEAVRADYVGTAERALRQEVIAHRSEIISASGICLEIFVLGKARGRPSAGPSGAEVPNPEDGRA